MTLALVGDRKGVRSRKILHPLRTPHGMYLLSRHSSLFAAVFSPVREEHGEMVLNKMYREGE